MNNIPAVRERFVSLQPNAFSHIIDVATVGQILDDIQSEKYSATIGNLRRLVKEGSTEDYKVQKTRLPAVTFCACFTEQRNGNNISIYNFLLIIDIDHIGISVIDAIKELLRDCPYIFACWVSPSGEGLKLLVPLTTNRSLDSSETVWFHKQAFTYFANYLDDKYKIHIDRSGSDVARLCFVTYDPNIIVNNACEPFHIDYTAPEFSKSKAATKTISLPKERIRKSLFHPTGKNNGSDRDKISRLIKYLNKRKLSITSEYEQWYRVAYALSSAFTFEVASKYFHDLSILDGPRYDAAACDNLLIYAFHHANNSITLGTIYHFASQIGFDTSYNSKGAGSREGGSSN